MLRFELNDDIDVFTVSIAAYTAPLLNKFGLEDTGVVSTLVKGW